MRPLIYLLTLSIFLLIGSPLSAQDAEENPIDRVKSWLEKNGLNYEVTDSGGFTLAFEAENAPVVEIQIDFSDDFIHFSSPIGQLPSDTDEGYFLGVILLTGEAPMVKPIIDEDNFFFLTIDLPKAALDEDEFMSDIILLVDFVDLKYKSLHPWNEE